MLSPKEFQELYMKVYEGMDPEERALKRELAADRRASKMEPKVGAKYAGSEGRSAARADKKSKGKHIHGTVDESAVGNRARNVVADQRLDDAQRETQKSVDKMKSGSNVSRASASIAANRAEKTARAMHPKPGIGAHRVNEAVYGGEKKEPEQPKDTRMVVTAADKKANTPAYQKFAAGDKRYKAAPHLGEDVELDEEKKELPQSKMYRKAGNLGREVVSSRKGPKRDAAMNRMNKIVSTINRETERKRFNEIGKSPAHNEEKEQLKMELIAQLRERALDAAEKREKEHVFKAIKPSKLAKSYPEKSPEQLKSLRYAISTSQAKKNMDTSRSDKRYGVER